MTFNTKALPMLSDDEPLPVRRNVESLNEPRGFDSICENCRPTER